MADTTMKTVLSLVATTSSRIRDLVIKDGQLIFIQDLGRIAFDFKGKREFYNQIVKLEHEAERQALVSPLSGYYFVIDSAVMWFYDGNAWIQMTEKPREVIFVGVELPELGQENTLYVNKNGGISIWDDETDKYLLVADKNEYVSESDIDALF